MPPSSIQSVEKRKHLNLITSATKAKVGRFIVPSKCETKLTEKLFSIPYISRSRKVKLLNSPLGSHAKALFSNVIVRNTSGKIKRASSSTLPDTSISPSKTVPSAEIDRKIVNTKKSTVTNNPSSEEGIADYTSLRSIRKRLSGKNGSLRLIRNHPEVLTHPVRNRTKRKISLKSTGERVSKNCVHASPTILYLSAIGGTEVNISKEDIEDPAEKEPSLFLLEKPQGMVTRCRSKQSPAFLAAISIPSPSSPPLKSNITDDKQFSPQPQKETVVLKKRQGNKYSLRKKHIVPEDLQSGLEENGKNRSKLDYCCKYGCGVEHASVNSPSSKNAPIVTPKKVPAKSIPSKKVSSRYTVKSKSPYPPSAKKRKFSVIATQKASAGKKSVKKFSKNTLRTSKAGLRKSYYKSVKLSKMGPATRVKSKTRSEMSAKTNKGRKKANVQVKSGGNTASSKTPVKMAQKKIKIPPPSKKRKVKKVNLKDILPNTKNIHRGRSPKQKIVSVSKKKQSPMGGKKYEGADRKSLKRKERETNPAPSEKYIREKKRIKTSDLEIDGIVDGKEDSPELVTATGKTVGVKDINHASEKILELTVTEDTVCAFSETDGVKDSTDTILTDKCVTSTEPGGNDTNVLPVLNTEKTVKDTFNEDSLQQKHSIEESSDSTPFLNCVKDAIETLSSCVEDNSKSLVKKAKKLPKINGCHNLNLLCVTQDSKHNQSTVSEDLSKDENKEICQSENLANQTLNSSVLSSSSDNHNLRKHMREMETVVVSSTLSHMLNGICTEVKPDILDSAEKSIKHRRKNAHRDLQQLDSSEPWRDCWVSRKYQPGSSKRPEVVKLKAALDLPPKVNSNDEMPIISNLSEYEVTNAAVRREKILPILEREQPSKTNAALTKQASILRLMDCLDDDSVIVKKKISKNNPGYKCINCSKEFSQLKMCCHHFRNCSAGSLEGKTVSLDDIRWVCTLCYSHFDIIAELETHRHTCPASSSPSIADSANDLCSLDVGNFESSADLQIVDADVIRSNLSEVKSGLFSNAQDPINVYTHEPAQAESDKYVPMHSELNEPLADCSVSHLLENYEDTISLKEMCSGDGPQIISVCSLNKNDDSSLGLELQDTTLEDSLEEYDQLKSQRSVSIQTDIQDEPLEHATCSCHKLQLDTSESSANRVPITSPEHLFLKDKLKHVPQTCPTCGNGLFFLTPIRNEVNASSSGKSELNSEILCKICGFRKSFDFDVPFHSAADTYVRHLSRYTGLQNRASKSNRLLCESVKNKLSYSKDKRMRAINSSKIFLSTTADPNTRIETVSTSQSDDVSHHRMPLEAHKNEPSSEVPSTSVVSSDEQSGSQSLIETRTDKFFPLPIELVEVLQGDPDVYGGKDGNYVCVACYQSLKLEEIAIHYFQDHDEPSMRSTFKVFYT